MILSHSLATAAPTTGTLRREVVARRRCVFPMEVINSNSVSEVEFRAWDLAAGAAMMVLGPDFRIRWCNRAFAQQMGMDAVRTVGAELEELCPPGLVAERRHYLRPLFARGDRVHFRQLFCGRRVCVTSARLGFNSLGQDAFLCAYFPCTGNHCGDKLLAKVGCLGEFAPLSRSELRVTHAFAQGLTREAIADRLYRSHHTVQEHLKRVYQKMGVSREVELALRLAKSGIGGFSVEEWGEIVAATTPRVRIASAPASADP